LLFWGVWEDKKTMQPLIDGFEKEHPNITIDYEQQDVKQLATDQQNYPKRLIAHTNTGDGPDIFNYHNSWYPMLSGILAPFPKDVINTQQYSSTFFPVVSQDLVHNGAIYGVPLGFDSLALFVNPDIFKGNAKVPTDWNTFYTTARSLTAKGSDGTITTSGAAIGTSTNINHADDIVGLLFAVGNVDPFNIGSNEDGAKQAIIYYTNFANNSGAVWDPSLPTSLQMFAQGNLAMYIGYSWDIAMIKNLNPNLQFTTYPMPTFYGVKRTIASYWAEGVSTRSKHPAEAMLFMKYLLDKKTNQLFYTTASQNRGFGEPYARKDLADTLKDNQLLYPFMQQGADAVSTFFIDDTFDDGINSRSNQYLNNAITQVSSNISPDQAISTLVSGIKSVLAQYGL